ncbi:unnamed protein product [Orchesella dallaii]|uniref:Very-long-chain 3-oxoacyl-CoA synthase n=1 Tax=Orchesella dallaii TaxID=48710 RepID=A0ABP1PTK2_9HEXA
MLTNNWPPLTFQCYSEYTVGNCQAWYYIAMFTFVFYIGEMGHAIYGILKPEPPRDQSVKKVILTMLFHATKIIYRAVTLMTVNNFLYDICRPVYKYLSQGSYLYTSYYNYRLGIPPPQRRRRMSSVTTQMIPTKLLQPPSSTQHLSRSGMPLGPSAPVAQFSQPVRPFINPRPIGHPTQVPLACAPSSNLPVYNSTKIPLQPIPNFNFYFTYPQPKPKQYKSPFDTSVNNNYAYYNTVNSLKQPP